MDALASVLSHLPRASAEPSEIAALEHLIESRLPDDYRLVIQDHDGSEGWIGGSYVSFWPVTEIGEHNRTLDVARYAPGLLLIGTDGGGEAFGFDIPGGWRVVSVPLVGLSRALAIEIGVNLADWLLSLASDSSPRPPNEGHGPAPRMNIYDVQPVIVGGSPTDASNKAWVTLTELLTIAKWWNERLFDSRRHTE